MTIDESEFKDINKLTAQGTGFTITDPNKIPYDVVINGFNLKYCIQNILDNYLPPKASEEIAEEIKEAIAVKLRLKQGKA